MSKHLYMVGIDGSEWSERAVERAINLAQSTSARVKLLYVLTRLEAQPFVYEGIAPAMISKEEEERQIEERTIQPLLKKYNHCNVKLDSEFAWGDPAETLEKRVKEEHANMLFLGRRGRSAYVDILLGSVANKLAHRIGIPIVLVP